LISSKIEYEKALEEVEHLTQWLARLEREKAAARKTLTTSSIRRMLARLQEELAEYEAADASALPEEQNEPNDSGVDREH
jgi:hypothetical protein